jgi:hypothetical protein
MKVLTTQGYVDTLDHSKRLYKYVGIGDAEKPHICIDTSEEECYEITFMSGCSVTLSDNLVICSEDETHELNALKSGVKLALVRTPDFVVKDPRTRKLFMPLVKDLIDLAKTGKKRKSMDGHHCDVVVDWSQGKVDSFIFGLRSLGIYIKVKKSNKTLIRIDSNCLNAIEPYLSEDEKKMDMFAQPNIDCERDLVEIVRDIKKIKNITLKTSSGIDFWESLVIDGFLCKVKRTAD